MICRYPFDTKKYKIKIESPTGEFAHENFPESRYAVDFILPLGTPVLDVRDGIVVSAKHDSDINLSTKEVESLSINEKIFLANRYTNLVTLDHGDGILTEYCHLSKRKILSWEQSVKEGEVIGYTGRSGFMDRDHLHFNAFMTRNFTVKSIPVEFICV